MKPVFLLDTIIYARLVREAGARTAATGQRVTVNSLVTEILADYFAARDRKRAGG